LSLISGLLWFFVKADESLETPSLAHSSIHAPAGIAL
jgi:hypothetical protein